MNVIALYKSTFCKALLYLFQKFFDTVFNKLFEFTIE